MAPMARARSVTPGEIAFTLGALARFTAAAQGMERGMAAGRLVLREDG